MKTQTRLYYEAQKRSADANETFLYMVEHGLTKDDLEKAIKRRPELWSRFYIWLDKLP